MSDIILTTEVAPSTPSAGTADIYVDSTTKKLCSKDDAGVVTTIGGVNISSQLILFGASATLDTTNGWTAGSKIEMGTNKQNLNNYPSAPTGTKTYGEWDFVMPSDWNGGTITAEFFWTTGNASTNSVVWGIQGRAYAPGDAIDQAWGTAIEVTSANVATPYSDLKSAATAAITLAGTTPAGGQSVRLRAYRLGSGADNLPAAALIKCVRINYTRS
jgi:hypothetical protein